MWYKWNHIRYVICKYFSSTLWFVFYPLNNVFWRVKIFYEVQFIIDVLNCVSGVVSKESKPRLQKFSPKYSSRSFICLDFSSYLFLFEWALAVCIFQRICSFYLYCWIFWHEDIYSFTFLVISVLFIIVLRLSYLMLIVFVCFGISLIRLLRFFSFFKELSIVSKEEFFDFINFLYFLQM